MEPSTKALMHVADELGKGSCKDAYDATRQTYMHQLKTRENVSVKHIASASNTAVRTKHATIKLIEDGSYLCVEQNWLLPLWYNQEPRRQPCELKSSTRAIGESKTLATEAIIAGLVLRDRVNS